MHRFETSQQVGRGRGEDDEPPVVLLAGTDAGWLSSAKSGLEAEFEEVTVLTASSARKALFRLSELTVSCLVVKLDDFSNPVDFIKSATTPEFSGQILVVEPSQSPRDIGTILNAGATDVLPEPSGEFRHLAHRVSTSLDHVSASGAEATLFNGTGYLRAVLDCSPDAVYVTTGDGTVVDVNDEAGMLAQRRRDQLVGSSLQEVLDMPTPGPFGDGGSRVSTGTVEGMQHRDRGDSVPVEIRISRVEGTPEGGFVAVARDIRTQSRHRDVIEDLTATGHSFMQAQSKQEITEIVTHAATDTLSMPVSGVWLFDSEDEVLRPAAASERATALFDEIPPIPLASGVGSAWKEEEERIFDERTRVAERVPGADVVDELVFPLGDHGVMIVLVFDPRLFRETDLGQARLLATTTEQALNQAQREAHIRSEQRFFDAAINTVDDLFLAINDSHTVLRWNEKAESLTESLGQNETPALPDVLQGTDPNTVATALKEGFQTGQSSLTTTLTTPDGEEIVAFEMARMAGSEEPILLLLGRDITALETHRAALQRQNERLETFSSVVSHDLQNPLQLATAHFDLIKDEVSVESAENVAAVERAHIRMHDLIDDLLTLAQQGGASLSKTLVDIGALARTSWTGINSEQAQLDIESDSHLGADPNQLRHLFENLMTNAVVHAGPDVTVTIGDLHNGFYVEDDGPGISGGHRDDIFETGFTTAENGTGIGLMIVKDVADRHDWSITATAAENGGARFEVTTE